MSEPYEIKFTEVAMPRITGNRSMYVSDAQLTLEAVRTYLNSLKAPASAHRPASVRELAEGIVQAHERLFDQLDPRNSCRHNVRLRDRLHAAMSQAKRDRLGKRAVQLLRRFPKGSRLYRKWERKAGRFGAIARVLIDVTPLHPAEMISVKFDLDKLYTHHEEAPPEPPWYPPSGFDRNLQPSQETSCSPSLNTTPPLPAPRSTP